ncbi:hypothetical protein CL622_02120 [archaeon]|nr:hypothetical protein [archaeon]
MVYFMSIKSVIYRSARLSNLYPTLYLGLEKIAGIPLKYQLELTTACNLACPFCTHKDLTQRPKMMTLEHVRGVVQSIEKELPIGLFKRFLLFNLTGIGEILLNKDTFEIIKYLKQKGAMVTFADNFTLMKEDYVRELINLKVDNIFISFDGATKKTYEAMRVGATFEDTIANIKRFVAVKKELGVTLPNLNLRFVPTSENINELPRLVDLVAEMGVKIIDIPQLYVVDKMNTLLKALERDFQRYKKEALQKASEKGISLSFSNPFVSEQKQPIKKCTMSQNSMYIDASGYVLPCCLITQMGDYEKVVEQFNQGNVVQDGVGAVWNNERYRNFRDTIKKNKVPLMCDMCDLYYGDKE